MCILFCVLYLLRQPFLFVVVCCRAAGELFSGEFLFRLYANDLLFSKLSQGCNRLNCRAVLGSVVQ